MEEPICEKNPDDPDTHKKPPTMIRCKAKGQYVCIEKPFICVVLKYIDIISDRFDVKLVSIGSYQHTATGRTYSSYQIFPNVADNTDVDAIGQKIQKYIESLSVTEAEDSSYDSDSDADNIHGQVSRTTSDTLAQEYAEYVTQPQPLAEQEQLPGYTQRVEFALKLGYTERLVQAALSRLGPNPEPNELLEELIKLGAQPGNKGEFCDAPHTEQPADSSGGHCERVSNNGLRPIVIDGSNVAMSHGNKDSFSCMGIKICVDWFRAHGHKDITVFVPKWRKENARPDNPIRDQEILNELEKDRLLVFTPSRSGCGKKVVCYDDRYILKLASENGGIVVSNDNYRDLVQEKSEFKRVVTERLLMYTFVNDRFMPPDDPLGRSGPTLENFLRLTPKKGDPPPPCPYGRKCTYGNKCKYYHPERGTGPHKSVIDYLSEHAARHLSARNSDCQNKTTVKGKSLSVPLCKSGETSPVGSNGGNTTNTNNITSDNNRKPLHRTRSGVAEMSNMSSYYSNRPLPLGDMLTAPCYLPPSSSSCQPPYSDQQKFPKSHSIENICHETYGGYSTMWSRQMVPPGSATVVSSSSAAAATSASCTTSGSVQQESEENINLHKKLQRQLTLNPAGCDPRIYQLQRVGCNSSQQQQQQQSQMMSPPSAPSCPQQQQQQQQQQQTSRHPSPHRPLAPTLSAPRNHHPSQWDLHQNVTRISSAPDPSRSWHTGAPLSSTSEPHINLWPPPQQQHRVPATLSIPPLPQTTNTTAAASATTTISPTNVAPLEAAPTVTAATSLPSAHDQRRHLHYHLSSIFPDEQVQTVMQLYPNETKAEKICAAILRMFPKI